jgi:outer membrane lipoprotein-sorting protein
MTRSVSAIVFVCLLSANAFSRAADDALAIVSKSIDAIGGEAKLAKHKAATFTETGKYYGQGEGQSYTGKYAMQHPGQFRMEIEGAFVIVLDGDKGWVSSGGNVVELSGEALETQKRDQQAGWMCSLLPLKDKAFTLKTLSDAEVDKRPVRVVKASREGYPEVTLYFDKESNYLVKSEFKTKAAEEGYKDVTLESRYNDFKEVDGVKIPHKMVMNRDGKVFVEAEVTAYKAEGKLDAKTFAKPE